MKRYKLYTALGMLVLAVVGFLTTSAHKKYYFGVKTAWFKTVNGTFVTLFHDAASFASHLTTTARAGHTTYFRTGASWTTQKTLFQTSNRLFPLYYR